jgi:ABC-type sugar transport system ATPase subunit
VYKRDAGVIRFKGSDVEIPNLATAQRLGISMIHQELNLMNLEVSRAPSVPTLLDPLPT